MFRLPQEPFRRGITGGRFDPVGGGNVSDTVSRYGFNTPTAAIAQTEPPLDPDNTKSIWYKNRVKLALEPK